MVAPGAGHATRHPATARGESPVYRTPCPNCGHRLKYAAEHFGKKARCPRCDQRLTLPSGPPGGRPGDAPEVLDLPPEVLDLPEESSPPPPRPGKRLPTIRPVPERGRVRWPWVVGGAAALVLVAAVAVVIASQAMTRTPTGDDTAAAPPDPNADPKPDPKPDPKGEPQPKTNPKTDPQEDLKPKSRPKAGGQATAPLLANVAVSSAKLDPLLVKFSVELDVVRGTVPFEERSGLWFCFGKPETIPSLRVELEKKLKGDDKLFVLNMRGPGFVAARCSGLKQDPENPAVWTGTIDLGKANVEGGQIEIPSAFGSSFYKVTEVPISWVYYDGSRRLSNELKAVVDLKAGKVVKVIEEAKQ